MLAGSPFNDLLYGWLWKPECSEPWALALNYISSKLCCLFLSLKFTKWYCMIVLRNTPTNDNNEYVDWMALCEMLTNILLFSPILFDIKATEQKLFLSAKKLSKFSGNWFQQDLVTILLFECCVKLNRKKVTTKSLTLCSTAVLYK